MTVAMGTDLTDGAGVGQDGVDGGQQLVGENGVALQVLCRDELLPDQRDAVITEALAVQHGAVDKRPHRTDGMDPAEHPAEDEQVVKIVKLGSVPPLAGIEGKTEHAVTEETLPGSC